MQKDVILKNADRLIQEFDIRTPGSMVTAGSLSGGNQQKVIIAREFSRPIKLLVASQPTRGLDVGSVEYIHRRILQKRDEGCAVLLVSSELDEIMQLSDRIAVMYRGKIVDILSAENATKEGVGLLMAGIRPEMA
jgi:simple sugar transport system ATP-binding protein